MDNLVDYVVLLSLSGWMWTIHTTDLSGVKHTYYVNDSSLKKIIRGSFNEERFDPKSNTIYLCPGRFNIEGKK